MHTDSPPLTALRQRTWSRIWPFASCLGLLAATTGCGVAYVQSLGLTVIALLYLLCVLWAAYFMRFALALLVAVSAFLLINFCFIEPRYTLQVASLQSWLMLGVFAIVAFTVSSVMQQLKTQTRQAQQAARESQFFQSLAELFAAQHSPQALLEAGCQHVNAVFGLQVSVLAVATAEAPLQVLAGDARVAQQLPPSSVQWALDFNRAIGAGTADWPALSHCLMPFGFQQREVLAIAAHAQLPGLDFLRLLAHQFAQAYVTLQQQSALAQSELRVSEATFKKTLLTALSHDMRTPLTAIAGAANVLTDPHIPLASAQSRQLLHSIQAESGYLIHATENILTLVKLESGPASLHLDWQLLEDVVEHVVQRYRSRALAVPIEVHVHDSGHLVKLDAMLVAHALANLIDNALVWHQGESAVEVHLRIQAAGMALSVTNDGPGFPAGFEVAAFVHAAQRPAGSRGFGLGLLIVHTVMDIHHGQLEIRSAPGEPTCVSMWFPLAQAPTLAESE